jgi:HAD superfamily hydrolase (TIGR01509 family)
MPAPYDLIIFDCDGVLVDSETLAVEAFVEVLREAGVPVEPSMVENCFGMKQADILLRMSELTGREIPVSVAEALWPATRRLFERALQPMSGVADFIDGLGHPKRCVASSSNPERIRISLELTGLIDRFDGHLFSSHQVARGKPAPDLFLFAAANMGVDPQRCLVIEDSVFGVQGARAAGMTAIGFVGGNHIPPGHAEDLERHGAELVTASWPAIASRIAAT